MMGNVNKRARSEKERVPGRKEVDRSHSLSSESRATTGDGNKAIESWAGVIIVCSFA